MITFSFRIIILVFLYFFIPSLSHASCAETLGQIKADLDKYGDNINNYTLPWMSPGFLKRNLQNFSQEPLNADMYEYTWHCDDENYLKVHVNNTGGILSMEGKYSSIAGGGLISATLVPKAIVVKTTTTVTRKVKPQVMQTHTTQIIRVVPQSNLDQIPKAKLKPKLIPAPVKVKTVTTVIHEPLVKEHGRKHKKHPPVVKTTVVKTTIVKAPTVKVKTPIVKTTVQKTLTKHGVVVTHTTQVIHPHISAVQAAQMNLPHHVVVVSHTVQAHPQGLTQPKPAMIQTVTVHPAMANPPQTGSKPAMVNTPQQSVLINTQQTQVPGNTMNATPPQAEVANPKPVIPKTKLAQLAETTTIVTHKPAPMPGPTPVTTSTTTVTRKPAAMPGPTPVTTNTTIVISKPAAMPGPTPTPVTTNTTTVTSKPAAMPGPTPVTTSTAITISKPVGMPGPTPVTTNTTTVTSKAASMPGPTPVTTTTTTVAKTNYVPNAADKVMGSAIEKSIKDFKTWFNVNVNSEDGLEAVAAQKLKFYYGKLKQCSPGSYDYPTFNPNLAMIGTPGVYVKNTSVISGDQGGKCMVKTSTELNDTTNQLSCAYSSADLSFFNDANADMAAHGTDKAQKEVLAKACQADAVQNTQSKDLASSYEKNLKSCTPGKYKVLVPNMLGILMDPNAPITYLTQQSVISGYQNKKCMVQNTINFNGADVSEKCAYTPGSIDFIANKLLKAGTAKTGAPNAAQSAADKQKQKEIMDEMTKVSEECTSQAPK